jgi:hypothetical protein
MRGMSCRRPTITGKHLGGMTKIVCDKLFSQLDNRHASHYDCITLSVIRRYFVMKAEEQKILTSKGNR